MPITSFLSTFSRTLPRVNDDVTDDNIIRRIRFAFWIPKATNTHSQYVIIIAFPLQQFLRERVCVLGLYVH